MLPGRRVQRGGNIECKVSDAPLYFNSLSSIEDPVVVLGVGGMRIFTVFVGDRCRWVRYDFANAAPLTREALMGADVEAFGG